MNIDPRKVNLSEKDIEDYLFAHPEAAMNLNGEPYIARWLARQFVVPSGIIDLLGYTVFGNIAIVELKNVPFESKHLTQISRYEHDIWTLLDKMNVGCIIQKYLVGPGVPDDTVLLEANSMGIEIYSFHCEYRIKVSQSWGFSENYYKERQDKYDQLLKGEIFSELDIVFRSAKVIELMEEKNDENTSKPL